MPFTKYLHNTDMSSQQIKASELKQIRTLNILNTAFITVLSLDCILCAVAERWYFMYSSVFLLFVLFLSRAMLSFNKTELASTIVAIGFYIAAIYHATVLDNITTSFFILLCTPMIVVVILSTFWVKIASVIVSTILYFICCYAAELPPFTHYFFFIGLYPCFAAMLYFYNRLETLTIEKNNLIKAQKDHNNDQVMYAQMMSHDLKAPLRSISGFSKLLTRQLVDKCDKQEMEMFEFILQGVDSMEDLIDDLLAYSQASTADYDYAKVEVETLLSSVKKFFHHDIVNNDVVITHSNLSTIVANPKAVTAVLQNLISNGIKYQPIAKKDHITKIFIEQKQHKHYDEIIVVDNGIGIEEQYLPYLFEPFKRFHSPSKYKGSGLGLSLCKKVLIKHRGDIKVTDSNQNGTTFSLCFPKKQP